MKKLMVFAALFLIGTWMGVLIGRESTADENAHAEGSRSAGDVSETSTTAETSAMESPHIPSVSSTDIRPSKVRLLIDRLRVAKAEDFPGIWEEMVSEQQVAIDQSEVRFDNSEMQQLVLSQWVSADPAGAWEYLQHESKNGRARGAVAAVWLSRDSDAAIEALTATPWAEFHSSIQVALANHDPQVAMAHWRAVANDDNPPPAIILAAIAMTDQQAVVALLDEHAGNYRSSPLSSITRSWPIERIDELVSVIAASGEGSDPRSRGRMRDGLPMAQRQAYSNLGSRLARESDRDAGLDIILSLPAGKDRDTILDGFIGPSRLVDPQMLSRIAQLPETELLEFENFDDLLRAKYDDHGETWKWLNSLPPAVRDKAFTSDPRSFAMEWAKSDPHAAASKIGELPAGDARNNFVAGLATTHGREFPDMGFLLLSGLPEDVRDGYATKFADECARHHPDKLVELLAATDDPKLKRALQQGGFSAIALDDPAGAAALLFEVSAGEDEIFANTRAVIYGWVNRDPGAAEQWVNALPDHVRDDATVDLGNSIGESHPRDATRIYLKIGDPERRQEHLQEHLGELHFLDPQATREHVEALSVDEAERASLLRLMESGD